MNQHIASIHPWLRVRGNGEEVPLALDRQPIGCRIDRPVKRPSTVIMHVDTLCRHDLASLYVRQGNDRL
jgi:hypothetical protein